MNILITGGNGFIGRNLIDFLKEHNLYVLDKEQRYETLDVRYLYGDITKIEDIFWCFQLAELNDEKIDYVIHLAAESGIIPSLKNPLKSIDVNINGTKNLLEISRKKEVKKFIFASSGGNVLGHQEPPVTEDTIPQPVSPYGASKIAGESLCQSYFRSFGLNTIILRFSNVYGPWSFHKKGNFFPELLKKMKNNETFSIFGDGEQTRDFIYVDDLCNAIISCLNNEKANGEIFQLGINKEISINQIINELNYTNIEYCEERIGEVKRSFCDNSKAKKMLGWEPSIDLKTGIEKLIYWFNHIH